MKWFGSKSSLFKVLIFLAAQNEHFELATRSHCHVSIVCTLLNRPTKLTGRNSGVLVGLKEQSKKTEEIQRKGKDNKKQVQLMRVGTGNHTRWEI